MTTPLKPYTILLLPLLKIQVAKILMIRLTRTEYLTILLNPLVVAITAITDMIISAPMKPSILKLMTPSKTEQHRPLRVIIPTTDIQVVVDSLLIKAIKPRLIKTDAVKNRANV